MTLGPDLWFESANREGRGTKGGVGENENGGGPNMLKAHKKRHYHTIDSFR